MQTSVSSNKAQSVLLGLIGSQLVCTLADGRRVTGRLICIDRMKNLILGDCLEERIIESTIYNPTKIPPVQRKVSRQLQQAMLPGDQLLSVKIHQETFQTKVAPVSND